MGRIPTCGRVATVSLGALCILSATFARAGRLDEALSQRLQGAAQDEFVSVVIRPTGTVDPAALKHETHITHVTRAARHKAVCDRLQSVAETSQKPVLAALTGPGLALTFESRHAISKRGFPRLRHSVSFLIGTGKSRSFER